ncbi:hypothetical protein ACNOYE_07905 [Nannocystaceae bacterium ST9]
MTDPSLVYVHCANQDCGLRTMPMSLAEANRLGAELPSYEEVVERQHLIDCPVCHALDRVGFLVYSVKEPWYVVPAEKSAEVVDTVSGAGLATWQAVDRVASSAVPQISGALTNDAKKASSKKVPRGIVTGGLAYGGHWLRFDDYDKSEKWGPLAPGLTEAMDRRADRILELQQDLILLAYFDGGRPNSDVPGYFDQSLAGSVLALKEDISFFYGVPTTTDASRCVVTPAKGGTLALEGLTAPIYYDPSLRNPMLKVCECLRSALGALEPFVGAIGYWAALADRLLPGSSRIKALSSKAKRMEEAANHIDDARGAAQSCGIAGAERSLEDFWAHPVWFYVQDKADKNHKSFVQAIQIVYDARDLLGAAADLVGAQVDPAASKGSPALAKLQVAVAEVLPSITDLLDVLYPLVGGLPDHISPYVAKLMGYAGVDWATAAYIKAMRRGIPIGSGGQVGRAGGTVAFHYSEDGIDKNAPETPDQALALFVATYKRRRDQKHGGEDLPIAILFERCFHESGFVHSQRMKKYGGAVYKDVRVAKLGLDWHNAAASTDSASKLVFSPLFTFGPGDAAIRGDHGPLVHSRGWGLGQETTATHGVKLTHERNGEEFISGLPLSLPDGTVVLPAFIESTETCIESITDLMYKYFASKGQQIVCTFGDSGGKVHDCHTCLNRFDIDKDFVHVKSANSYKLDVSDDRFDQLVQIMNPADADRARKSKVEYPCSWLKAVMNYAGSGERAFARLQKTARAIAHPKDDPEDEADDFFAQNVVGLSANPP